MVWLRSPKARFQSITEKIAKNDEAYQCPNLQTLSINAYLGFLEQQCLGYVQMKTSKSPILIPVAENLFKILKSHINHELTGAASPLIRQTMMKMIMSGKFPRDSYKRKLQSNARVAQKIQRWAETHNTLAGNSEDSIGVTEAQACVAPCCTGAYVAETMLTVIISADIQELDIPSNIGDNIKKSPKGKIRSRDLPQDIPGVALPAILCNYTEAIQNIADPEKFPLKSLSVGSQRYDPSGGKRYGTHVSKPLTIYEYYEEFDSYNWFSKHLCFRDSENGYLPYSDHLTFTLSKLFSVHYNHTQTFGNLTEINLADILWDMKDFHDPNSKCDRTSPIALMKGIGMTCTSLKTFKISDEVPVETLVHLFFKDAYSALHPYFYTYGTSLVKTDYGQSLRFNYKNKSLIWKCSEDTNRYCPICPDPWCSITHVRENFSQLKYPIFTIDDRMYDRLLEKFPGKKESLIGCIKSVDLVKSATTPYKELVRPGKLTESNKPPKKFWEYDIDGIHYRPKNVKYWESRNPNLLKLQPLCKSLQVLNLNSFQEDCHKPKNPFVPFLLTVLPNIKSFGYFSVLEGLKYAEEIGLENYPSLKDNLPTSIEEMHIDFKVPNYDGIYPWIKPLYMPWTGNDKKISREIDRFYEYNYDPQYEDEIYDLESFIKALIIDKIRLLTTYCPKVSKLSIFWFQSEEDNGPVVMDKSTWEKLTLLNQLTSFSLNVNYYSNVRNILRPLVPQLKSLELSIHYRTPEDKANPRFLGIDELLDICDFPSLKNVSVDYGDLWQVHFVGNGYIPQKAYYEHLTTLGLSTFVSWDALKFIWEKCINLETLDVKLGLCQRDEFSIARVGEPFWLSELEASTLAGFDSMKKLSYLHLGEITGRPLTLMILIDTLPSLKQWLEVKVTITTKSEEILAVINEEMHYESLFRVLTDMHLWYKKGIKDAERRGIFIKWKWHKIGAVDTLIEIFMKDRYLKLPNNMFSDMLASCWPQPTYSFL